MLVYVLDMADTENRPEDAFRVLKAEVESYDPELAARPYLILANKMDEEVAEEQLQAFIEATGEQPIPMSLVDETHPGLNRVRQALRDALKPKIQGAFNTPSRSKTPIDHTEVSEERFRMATFLKP
jgi:GTP-binding protein